LEKSFLIDVVSKIYVATDSSPVDMQTYELCSDMIDVVIDVSCIYGMKEDSDGLAYDDKSQSLIKLSNGMVLYLREVNKCVQLPSPPQSSRHTTSPTHASHTTQHTQLSGTLPWCASCGRRTSTSTVRCTVAAATTEQLRDDAELSVLSWCAAGLLNYNFQCLKQSITEVFQASNTAK
jgi:hypothetical protein